ncbi:hypothetical protein BJV78DRAFT_432119 [Lactifluus subvellereus]|nr:hypothetical protein BJV78DRAFT_432119 [Lactifluus subvellereus]
MSFSTFATIITILTAWRGCTMGHCVMYMLGTSSRVAGIQSYSEARRSHQEGVSAPRHVIAFCCRDNSVLPAELRRTAVRPSSLHADTSYMRPKARHKLSHNTRSSAFLNVLQLFSTFPSYRHSSRLSHYNRRPSCLHPSQPHHPCFSASRHRGWVNDTR